MCKRECNNLSVGHHKFTSQLASILYHNEVRLSNIWAAVFKIFRGIFFVWAAGGLLLGGNYPLYSGKLFIKE